jgi:hypothetical protein
MQMHPDQTWKGTLIGFLATSIALVAQVPMSRVALYLVVGGLVLYAALVFGIRMMDQIGSGPHEAICGCLKTWPEFFDAVDRGRKPFELRKDDRGFDVGQIWCLNRFEPDESHPEGGIYTGRWIKVRITYIVRGPIWGLADGWVIFGFTILSRGGRHVQGGPR